MDTWINLDLITLQLKIKNINVTHILYLISLLYREVSAELISFQDTL